MSKIYAEREIAGTGKKLTGHFTEQIWNSGVPKKNGWVKMDEPVKIEPVVSEPAKATPNEKVAEKKVNQMPEGK